MAETTLGITGRLEESVIVIHLAYDPSDLLHPQAGTEIGALLVKEYEKWRNQGAGSRSCVLEMETGMAGSSTVRALFELYKAVRAQAGSLFCVGFPTDNLLAITTLGMHKLPGFQLKGTLKLAIDQAKA